jgi:hypothetical protein
MNEDDEVELASQLIDTLDWVTPWQALRATGLSKEELTGDRMWGMPSLNVWACVGISHQAVQILQDLRERHALAPAHLLVYLMEGEALAPWMKMVGKRPPKNGYRDERFCCVAFRSRRQVVPS